jgi:hypothetical protein
VAEAVSIPRVNAWIYQTLSQDSVMQTLVENQIYRRTAIPGATFPRVIYQFQAGTVFDVLSGIELWSNMVYLVKAVDFASSPVNLEAIVNRFIFLLDKKNGRVGNGQIFTCNREQDIEYTEQGPEESPASYEHMGSLFRILARTEQ